jgi:hypothetical protein
MKKIILNCSVIVLSAIALTSCSKKPEDACGCVEKAANAFMVQGVEIQSIKDLREPCKDLIDSFEEDAAARALIQETATRVLESLKNKELIKVEGEDLPVLPSYTFNTVAEFNIERYKDGGQYKFFRTHVTVNEPVYLGSNSGWKNTAFSSSAKDQNVAIILDSAIKDNPFYSGIDIDDFYLLVDTKTHDFLLDSSKFKIASHTAHVLNWNEGSTSGIQKSIDAFNEIEKVVGFNTFISDLKTGRYYRVGNFNMDGGDTKEFQKQAASLSNVFGKSMCFSKADSFSGIYMKGAIEVDKITNIKKVSPPNLELLNRAGEQMDIKAAIERYLNRDRGTDYPGGGNYN